jgi:hypothetical protein
LADDALQERNVLADELLLQADRVRGNDDPAFLVRQRRLNGRDEIGEALADAGAGLDHQVPPLGDRQGDGVGHGKLLRPGLVVPQPLGDGAVGAEDGAVGHGDIVGELHQLGKAVSVL